MPAPSFITIPARLGKEAQLAYNDVWPGDLVSVSLGSLASEAALEALAGLNRRLEHDILEAFAAGQDFVVGPIEQTKPSLEDWFSPRPLFGAVKYEVTVKAGAVEPGSFAQSDLPAGWRLFRLADWKGQADAQS